MATRLEKTLVPTSHQSSPSHSAQHNFLSTSLEHRAYNVVDFGAVGDGSTDDTTSIQAAIDAANTASGGAVFFPTGTYLSTKLTLYTAVSLCGISPHASILKLKNSSNTALLTTNGFVTTDTSTGIHSFQIENLGFNGNTANQSSNADSGVVQLYGYNYSLSNVRIFGGKTVGLYTNWGTAAGAPGPNGIAMESRFYNVQTFDNTTDGVVFGGPHDSLWVSCTSYNNSGIGFNIAPRGNACQFVNCHAWGSSHTFAYSINGTNVSLINCQAEGAATVQVEILKNDMVWCGGIVFAAGGATTGFRFGAASLAGIRIVGTQISACTTAGVALQTNDNGGNLLDFQYIASSGSPYTGTVGVATSIHSVTSGGATGMPFLLPHGLAIEGGNNTDPGSPWIRTSTNDLVINASAAGKLYLGFDAGTGGIQLGNGAGAVTGKWVPAGGLSLLDGITEPGTDAGYATIYVDTADGDLKVKFGDGTVKLIVADT